MQHGACHLCAWLDEQAKLQVERLQPRLADSGQQVQLCLPHARAVLRHTRDEETQHSVAQALLRSGIHVKKRLERYVYKCSERHQVHMQPDERVAWFDAMRWFGGSESAAFLLTSSAGNETPG